MRMSRRIVLTAIVLNWSFCILYYVAWIQPSTDIVDDYCSPFGVWPNAETQNAVGVLTLFLHYLIPIAVLVFCYGRIIFTLQSKVYKEYLVVKMYDYSRMSFGL